MNRIVTLAALLLAPLAFAADAAPSSARLASNCAVAQVSDEGARSWWGCSGNGFQRGGAIGIAAFLEDNRAELGLPGGAKDLLKIESKHGLSSYHERFLQTVAGLPIHDAWVSVHTNGKGRIVAVHARTHEPTLSSKPPEPKLSSADAVAKAHAAIDGVNVDEPLRHRSRSRLVWFASKSGLKLAWELMVFTSEPLGDFLTVVDAMDGSILRQENRISFATGSGSAFVPNPYQTQGSATGMVDNNDANSPAFTAQQVPVTLLGLDDGTNLIRGEFVDLSTLNSASLPDVDASEVTRIYNYDRSDARFEQVVVYFAVDSIQRYFHSLGFDDDTGLPNGIRDFPTMANAHWYTQDQSFYSTGDDAIHMGDGGVDDAEDADIIIHEYGHSVQHDQNASWGGGEMGAMGEGFGDYLAASFYQTFGNPTFQASHAPCVGEWDATSYSGTNPPCLRRVDGTKTYPGDLTGSVHGDGEIWSRSLWDLRAAVGAATADQLVLEAHFGLPGSSSMTTAGLGVLQADCDLNNFVNETEVRTAFCDRGIFSGAQCVDDVSFCPGAGFYTLDATPGAIDVCQGTNAVYTIDVATSTGSTDPVTLTVSGDPAGTTAGFSTNPVVPGNSSTLTIGNTAAASAGSYNLSVDGADGNANISTFADLGIFAAASVPTLSSPADAGVVGTLTPTLSWVDDGNTASWSIEVATDAGFTTIVDSASVSSPSHTTATLTLGTTYYWRVSATNVCGTSASSATRTFSIVTPGSCAVGQFTFDHLSVDFESGDGGFVSSGTGNTWALSTARPNSGASSFLGVDVAAVTDQRLDTPAVALPVGHLAAWAIYWDHQTIEDNAVTACYDAAIFEISTDGGAIWNQLSSELSNPYDGTVGSSFSNPLGGLEGWCGDPRDWTETVVDLSAFIGQTIQLRFRLGTDTSVAREGWYVDDVVIRTCSDTIPVELEHFDID